MPGVGVMPARHWVGVRCRVGAVLRVSGRMVAVAMIVLGMAHGALTSVRSDCKNRS
jgi:hypothetical protein